MDNTEKVTLYEAIDTFRVFCGMVLLSFAQYGHDQRETTSRNFVARGMSCLQSIFSVWEIGNEQDAWILSRSLIDRLLHLHYLAETDSFIDFDNYSFMSMFKAREKTISNSLMNNKISQEMKDLHKSEKPKFDYLQKNQRGWYRPRPREVAKQMELNIVYDMYDYASMHVHPISNDGVDDFEKLIGKPGDHLPDSIVVRNSIIIQSLLVQEALNVSKMKWRAIVYDFLNQIRTFAGNGDAQYLTTMYKLGKAWPEFNLCEVSIPESRTTPLS
jgi:hypothetical protein